MVSVKDIKLCTVLAVTLIYFFVQIVASHLTHSLTLLNDSYHMLYNILSLFCCFISLKMSRAKSLRNTFGWARIEVLGILASILFLAALCFSVVVEALQTIVHASHQDAMHHPIAVMIIGGIGIVVNMICFILLGGYTHEQGCFLLVEGKDVSVNVVLKQDTSLKKRKLNLKETDHGDTFAFYLHLFLDFLRDISGCLIVILCSAIVHYFEGNIALFADPLFSILSVIIILATSYPFIKQSGMILLQNIPDNIDVSSLQKRMLEKFPSVLNIHDLHVWRLTRNKIIATCHIICMHPKDYKSISSHLKDFFLQEGITLATVQPEFIQNERDSPIQNKECILGCGNQLKKCRASRCCRETEINSMMLNSDTIRQRQISLTEFKYITEHKKIEQEPVNDQCCVDSSGENQSMNVNNDKEETGLLNPLEKVERVTTV